ncbi:hypothetical protein [Nocardia sp. NPDC046763]
MNCPHPHLDSDLAAMLGWVAVALLIIAGGWLLGEWLTCWGAPL